MNTSASKGMKDMPHSEVDVFMASIQLLMPFEAEVFMDSYNPHISLLVLMPF